MFSDKVLSIIRYRQMAFQDDHKQGWASKGRVPSTLWVMSPGSQGLGQSCEGSLEGKEEVWLVRLIWSLGAFMGHGQAEEEKFCYPWAGDIFF